MPQSMSFKKLKARIKFLTRHFLPNKFDPVGQYSVAQLDRARAFGLLVHAELEHYIEDMAKGIAIEKIRQWKKGKRSTVIVGLLTYDYKNGRDTWVKRLDKALNRYIAAVSDNHGIKDKNLEKLLLPLGVDIASDLDSMWVIEMTNFANQRGEIAHKAIGVQQTIDPKTESERIKLLMKGMATLDEVFLRLKKTRV